MQKIFIQLFYPLDGMENWGLVTYREENLLINENSDAAHKQEAASLVCHEIAHQWFGNLVTMVQQLH